MTSSEKEMQQALKKILDLYDIKLDTPAEDKKKPEEEEKTDYSEIISKTQDRLDELNQKAEEIFQRTGMSREQLESYASNPNNFSKEQWEALLQVKEACEKYKREARTVIAEQPGQTGEGKKPRKKAEGRFAKKKTWIPL